MIRVLIAEDQDLVRGALAALLSLEGDIEIVDQVDRGDEVVGHALQHRPDVALLDIEMPGQDGYSLIRKLRALGPEQGGKTPAVALTAFGRPEDRIRSLRAGFNIHVSKPADPAELVAIVASILGRAG